MNIYDTQVIQHTSDLLKEICTPARLRILLAIGNQEACVCHLEAVLGMRQAYLSQHLMALRRAGILATNRDGRFIYYRLAKPQILDVIKTSADSLGITLGEHEIFAPMQECSCPRCHH